MRKAEAALSQTRKRILYAVLAGLGIGLLVSVASLSHVRLSGGERSKLDKLQAHFDEQLAERVRARCGCSQAEPSGVCHGHRFCCFSRTDRSAGGRMRRWRQRRTDARSLSLRRSA
jgi:hypothetical protein